MQCEPKAQVGNVNKMFTCNTEGFSKGDRLAHCNALRMRDMHGEGSSETTHKTLTASNVPLRQTSLVGLAQLRLLLVLLLV